MCVWKTKHQKSPGNAVFLGDLKRAQWRQTSRAWLACLTAEPRHRGRQVLKWQGMGNMLEFPVSPAQASFESAILNSRCHKSLCFSVKEEQMAQGTTGRSSFTKQESITAPPIPPHHCSHLFRLPSSLMSLLRAHLPGAKSSAGCRGKVWESKMLQNWKLSSVLCSGHEHRLPQCRVAMASLNLDWWQMTEWSSWAPVEGAPEGARPSASPWRVVDYEYWSSNPTLSGLPRWSLSQRTLTS